MASALDLLFGGEQRRIGTPGFNPNAPDPRPIAQKPPNPLDQFLGSPGGSLLINLLAQGGSSPVPTGGPLAAIGRAGLQTQQQGLVDELLRSRIGLNRAQTTGGGATAGNVQTTFKGANGNMHIVTRRGDVKDTGVPFNENVKFFTQPDDSVIGVDASTGERLGTVISAEEASEARRRKTTEADITKSAIELPQALVGLDSQIASIDSAIGTLEDIESKVTGRSTGFTGARLGGIEGTAAFDLRSNIKTIQANLAFGQLQKMRAASKTGGALGQVSERELDLLEKAVQSLDPNQSEGQLRSNIKKVFTHYNNYKREIGIMKIKLQERAGVTPDTTKPISEMTEAELTPNSVSTTLTTLTNPTRITGVSGIRGAICSHQFRRVL